MRKLILLFLMLLSFTFINAQQLNEINVIVSGYPKSFTEAEDLANLINTDFDSDEKKARAIYSWITMNVKYDIKAYYSKKRTKRIKYNSKAEKAMKLRKQRVRIENKTLQENKAVAEGYTTLYKRLCDLTGLYSYIIKGTAKLRTFDIGKQPRIENHAWNAVQIEKKWYFVDATFGAGTVNYIEKTYQHDFNEKYFFTPPEKFFLNHYPKEKSWLLVEKTPVDFANLPLFHSQFLRADLELIEPQLGVLDLKSKDTIQFKIKSPDPIEKLTYKYSFEKEPCEILIDPENEGYSFDIPFVKKRGGYLTIFYNNKEILTFKIGTY